MKIAFNYCLRLVVKIALHIFYHKITIVGKENIPKNKAVLIIANHQNALIDPLLIATHTKLKPHFLTRASAFKNPIYSKMLYFIRMIPIYRARDGMGTVKKNHEIMEKCATILQGKGTMLIFGEGGLSPFRKFRTLQKGFARIAFQALENDPNLELVILPVGINYSNHNKSGSKVRIIFGTPIYPKNYYPDQESLIDYTHQILDPLVCQLLEQNHQDHLSRLIENKIDLTDPYHVKQFLESSPIEDAVEIQQPYFTNKVMKIFHFPLYLAWLAMSKRVQDKSFTATFKFLIGLVGIPLWYAFLLIFLPWIGHGSWSISWVFLGFLFLLVNRNGQE